MFDIEPLFDLSFWFQLSPQALTPAMERGFFLLFAGMILFGAIARIVARGRKDDIFLVQAYKKMAQMLLVMGALGMAWFFFTFEELYLLGARFWFLFWITGLVVWAVFIYRYMTVTVPQEREARKNQAEANKYLPRKNRRK